MAYVYTVAGVIPFIFFTSHKRISPPTCDPLFRNPLGNEPHLQPPWLIFFYHKSQHFFLMDPVEYSCCSAH